MTHVINHPSPLIAVKVEAPTKCVSGQRVFAVKASVDFIDFEGRSDGESIKKLIAQIKPREMV